MLVLHGDRTENKIALTFDDGPNPYGTREVLSILDGYSVTATFFLIGERISLYPDIIHEIEERGHVIGNHGYSHSRFKRDFNKSSEEIFRVSGRFPYYIRPPYFNLSLCIPEVFSRKVYVIGGDVIHRDREVLDKNEIVSKVVKEAKKGSIVVFHDGSKNPNEQHRFKSMLEALPGIIEALKVNYDLVGLDQMKL